MAKGSLDNRAPTKPWPRRLLFFAFPLLCLFLYLRRSHTPLTDSEEGMNAVIMTYKRPQHLKLTLDRIARGTIPSLKHIDIIWIDNESPAPDFISTYTTLPITLHYSKTKSLNERFRPVVRTDLPILMLDDDLVIDPREVQLAYMAFRDLGDKYPIVGFSARRYSTNQDDTLEYEWDVPGDYSMILTNAAIFHPKWMQEYWSKEWKSYRAVVDEAHNCEDILFNYIVSHKSRRPPLAIQPQTPMKTYVSSGFSTSAGHFDKRSHCMNAFTNLLGYTPLIRNHWAITRDARDHWETIDLPT